MTAFLSEDDIRQSAEAAGLGSFADAIVATARPTILFTRRQATDRALPTGRSKLGGLPDLPGSMEWPHRPPLADAAERAERIREAQAERHRKAGTTEDEDFAEIAKYLPDLDQAEWQKIMAASRPDQAAVTEAQEKLDRFDRLLTDSFSRSFPLAFVGQLDLAGLSPEAGFDLDLPEHGLLSFFEDATAAMEDSPLHVVWIDHPLDTLERRALPAALEAFADGTFTNEPWNLLTEAEVLDAHSALTIPHHWRRRGMSHSDQFHDLLREPAHGFTPGPVSQEDGKEGGYFGDRLGGWPDPIQGDPEDEFTGRAAIVSPGDDSIRHLFSWGGEYFGGTQRIDAVFGGDGTTYAMIARDDLLGRNFSRAVGIYQCD